MRLVVGCRLDLRDGTVPAGLPDRPPGLCAAVPPADAGKARAGKGAASSTGLTWPPHAEGLIAILLPDGDPPDLTRAAPAFGDRAYLALTLRRRPGTRCACAAWPTRRRPPAWPPWSPGTCSTTTPERRMLQDVMSCIREGCTIDDAGHRLERFADRHLRAPDEMARLFADYPEAIARTAEIAERCTFSLASCATSIRTRPSCPARPRSRRWSATPGPACPTATRTALPPEVEQQLRHELQLIAQLGYAPYFLTVNTIVRQARSHGHPVPGPRVGRQLRRVLRAGRHRDRPGASNLLFERFVSAERHEPPDIDVDFEHERREEVIQWIYQHYGRDRAALCATVVRYRSRGAVREVGKVMGLTEDVTAALASQVWGWSEDGVEEHHAEQLNLNLADRRLRLTLELARALIGHPRHMSQHPGGFVLTQDRLADLVPVEPASMKDRQVIEWDKDDIDILKFMKVDVLGLGMLGCLRRAFDLLDGTAASATTWRPSRRATPDLRDDPGADTLGTFQIESRAQMSMLPRHKPATCTTSRSRWRWCARGRSRATWCTPTCAAAPGWRSRSTPHPELETVLGKTLGVPLFQEQAMQVAIVCAGFTPGEADQLRRAMATFKKTGGVGASGRR